MRRRADLLVVMLLVGLALPAAAAEPARLTLDVQAQDDGTVRLTALATDGKGAPASSVPVTFKVQTTFGRLIVAEVPTDGSGRAVVVLPQLPRSGAITVEADAGEKTLQASKRIDRAPPTAPQTRPGVQGLQGLSPQPGLISPYPVPLEVVFLIVVLGGIWTTYAYLVSLLVKIRRAPAGPGPAGWGTRESQWR